MDNLLMDLAAYIQAKGFKADPFETSAAETEAAWLPSLFVQTNVFPQIANNHCAILFAPQGHGKTSHCMEVARIVSERRPPALVITFIDFDVLITRGLDQLTPDDYVDVLRPSVLKTLHKALDDRPDLERDFQRKEYEYALFCALLETHFPDGRFNRWKPPLVDKLAVQVKQRKNGAREALEELSTLAKAAQFDSVYVLFDGFDEWDPLTNDIDTSIKVLRPLLGSPVLLYNSGIIFKFFLPALYQETMAGKFRLDKIRSYSLSWNSEQLKRFLANRLTIYSQMSETSRRGWVERFQVLCEESAGDVDTLLVEAAQLSPRTLLHLGRRILQLHCESVEDSTVLISSATIKAVLSTTDSYPTPTRVSSFAGKPAGTPALLLVSEKELFLGNQRLKQPTGRLQRCLSYLWENRHQRVPHTKLRDYVYDDVLAPEKLRQRSSLDESLYKLIGRLRKLLEPASSLGISSSSTTYIEGTPSTGYRLHHFHDEGERQRHR